MYHITSSILMSIKILSISHSDIDFHSFSPTSPSHIRSTPRCTCPEKACLSAAPAPVYMCRWTCVPLCKHFSCLLFKAENNLHLYWVFTWWLSLILSPCHIMCEGWSPSLSNTKLLLSHIATWDLINPTPPRYTHHDYGAGILKYYH